MEQMRLAQKREEDLRQELTAQSARVRQETHQIEDVTLSPHNDSHANRIVVTDTSAKIYVTKFQNDDVFRGRAYTTIFFADFVEIGPIHPYASVYSFLIRGKIKDMSWDPYQTEISCRTEAEIQKVRRAILKAFADWSTRFPNAVPKVHIGPS